MFDNYLISIYNKIVETKDKKEKGSRNMKKEAIIIKKNQKEIVRKNLINTCEKASACFDVNIFGYKDYSYTRPV